LILLEVDSATCIAKGRFRMAEAKCIVTGIDPASDRLCVLSAAGLEADLGLIDALARASTLGDVREHPKAWAITASFPKYDDEGDEQLNVDHLPDDTPFEFGQWFGEWAFGMIPQARLRTAELCPQQVLDEFGRADGESGFMDYEPAPWLSPDDREAIERRLKALGFEVKRGDDRIADYLDV
jgi:hypothetical protein